MVGQSCHPKDTALAFNMTMMKTNNNKQYLNIMRMIEVVSVTWNMSSTEPFYQTDFIRFLTHLGNKFVSKKRLSCFITTISLFVRDDEEKKIFRYNKFNKNNQKKNSE